MTDIELAKRTAWRTGTVFFAVPPVCTAGWNEDAWIRWVDWTTPANHTALQSAVLHPTEAEALAAHDAWLTEGRT